MAQFGQLSHYRASEALAFRGAKDQTAGPVPSGLGSGLAPMTGIRVPQLDERQGDGRQAADLVGREAEVDRIRAFVATARTDGGALLVTGEPVSARPCCWTARRKAASAAGTRILRAAGIQFEAGMSFSGPNQVLLPLLGEVSKLPAVHRGASTRMRSRTLAPSSGKRASRSAAAASPSSRWTSRCGSPT